VLYSFVFVESHPRPHSPVPSPQRSDLQTFRRADDPCPAKPFSVNLFADPHPLNPYAAIFYKKGGGRGLSHLPTLRRSNVQTSPIPISPLDATLLRGLASVDSKQFTGNLNPLDATLTKKRGGGGTSFKPRILPAKRSSLWSSPLSFVHSLFGPSPPRHSDVQTFGRADGSRITDLVSKGQ